MIKKFLKNRNQLFFIAIFVLIGLIFVTNPAFASVGTFVGSVIAGILGLIIRGLTKIMALLIEVFVGIAQYNNFTEAIPVKRGWIIVRDISNMFFVLVMLIISFATILKRDEYGYKKYLPKLILMAVAVNFSKTICGLFIDFSQVIMLTFVNGFKDIGEGSLIHMMGLKEIFTLQQRGDVDFPSLVSAYLLGLLYVIIGLVVIIAMTIALAMRMIFLWIYVILSPLAFLLSAFPGGKQYSSQWWSRFTKELIAGPVLAFFVWLSFASVTATSSGSDLINMKKEQFQKETASIEDQAGDESANNVGSGISEAAEPDVMIRFIISIGMLVGGLMLAQSVGGAVGGMAGKGIGALQKGQKSIQNYGTNVAKRNAKIAGQYGTLARDNVSGALGVELSGKKRKANRAARLEGNLAKASDNKQEKFLERAQEGGFRGGLAASASGQGQAFEGLRFGKQARTKQVYKAKQDLAKANQELKMREDSGGEKPVINALDEAVIRGDISEDQKESYNTNKKIFDKSNNEIDKLKNELKDDSLSNKDKKKKRDDLKNSMENRRKAEKEMNEIGSKVKMKDGTSVASFDLRTRKYKRQKEESEKTLENLSGKKTFDAESEIRKIDAKKQKEANDKIAHIDNINELQNTLKSSIASGDKELSKAIMKKMAKTGNADKINKAYGLGNDRKGMLALAD